ncbi:MAG: hypothetical protein IPK15_21615 [Verrucomicrobia bacterium]|nr:hypothetical protein [Verrucomicrobiota bacterium]
MPALSEQDVAIILSYLSSEDALALFAKQKPEWLQQLKSLPLFPLSDGSMVSIAGEKCFFPSNINPPAIRFEIKLLKRGVWDGLLRLLGIAELSLVNLIEQVLLPTYSTLLQPDQAKVLAWIRDHFEQALTQAGSGQAEFLAKLCSAPLIRCANGELHAGAVLYDPREPVILEVLGNRAHLPVLDAIPADRDRWLLFYERLGMTRNIRPQDLVDYICARVSEAHTSLTPEIERQLARVLRHISEHWSELQGAQITRPDGVLTKFSEFLAQQAWCPALRENTSLRQFVVYQQPENRLFKISELAPRSKGYLVSSVRPLLAFGPSDSVPQVIRDLSPQSADPPLDLVASHFENILEQFAALELSDRQVTDLLPVLQRIYAYFGSLLPAEANANDSAPLRQLRDRFRNQSCILVENLKAFRRPDLVFRSKVSCVKDWLFHAAYTKADVDAGMTALGRRDEPDLIDLCKLTVELGEAYRLPLDEELSGRFLRLLSQMAPLLPSDETQPPELRVLDSQCLLVPRAGLFFRDADWLPEISPGLIPLAHPKAPELLVDRLGIKRLSKHAQPRPKGELTPSANPSFVQKCEKLERLLHSPDLEIGLRRILAKLLRPVAPDAFGWLRGISLKPVQTIRCDLVVSFDGGDIVIGPSESNTYSVADLAGVTDIYVGETASMVLENEIAGALQERFSHHPPLPASDLSEQSNPWYRIPMGWSGSVPRNRSLFNYWVLTCDLPHMWPSSMTPTASHAGTKLDFRPGNYTPISQAFTRCSGNSAMSVRRRVKLASAPCPLRLLSWCCLRPPASTMRPRNRGRPIVPHCSRPRTFSQSPGFSIRAAHCLHSLIALGIRLPRAISRSSSPPSGAC